MAVAVYIRKASGFSPKYWSKIWKDLKKNTFGDTEMFNTQLVAALADGCSNLHQEGIEFFLKVLSQILKKIET